MEWVNKSFIREKTVDEEEPNHATIQVEIEDNILPITEEDSEKRLYAEKPGELVEEMEVNELKDDKQVPLPVVAVRIKSPMKDLHDVVSHNIIEFEIIHETYEKVASTCDVEESEVVAAVLNNVGVAAGISPKSHSKASKKKHGNSKGQPLRVIPYRATKDVDIVWDDSQQISCKLTFQQMNKIMIVTVVYAKCDAMEILALWNSLYVLADGMVALWLIGGDFNVILNEEEKIGGLPVLPSEYEDFAFCINSCELIKAGFKGSPFTWWNGRSDGQCIFKRLDKMLYNNLMQQWYGLIEVDHLARTGSDHAPLLLSCNEQQQQFIRPFQFMKQVFGDIFKQLTIREDIVRIKEQLFEESPTEVNRMGLQRAQAELKRYLHYEEEFWRQKSSYDCFAEGDKNTRFFHNIVNGRRKRTLIRRIQNADGNGIESANEIADEAISFYQKQFSQESMQNFQSEMAILDHIPSMLSQEENADIVAIPTMEEVKRDVFELSGDSISGPDGLTCIFYQCCWETIDVDVFNTVKVFFEGQTLPKSITHTNLVLLPKKNEVESYSDMRPISLSNFINKVISRVVHNKLEKALPRLISTNQSGFVKGRNIIENVWLTQEIVSDIRLRGKPANVVLKLDMTKAYDRAS
ncbi:uncharacterized protein LOC132601723 [Lycium barbarum]|uniref:uncharacterized protein LOC132601723 n=1 Tax=Lycium barbarum TaxID=112863 RepID=UPI00293E03DA|nr:uncharacterized protein LOC132601723 [Lycium barbarum]